MEGYLSGGAEVPWMRPVTLSHWRGGTGMVVEMACATAGGTRRRGARSSIASVELSALRESGRVRSRWGRRRRTFLANFLIWMPVRAEMPMPSRPGHCRPSDKKLKIIIRRWFTDVSRVCALLCPREFFSLVRLPSHRSRDHRPLSH